MSRQRLRLQERPLQERVGLVLPRAGLLSLTGTPARSPATHKCYPIWHRYNAAIHRSLLITTMSGQYSTSTPTWRSAIWEVSDRKYKRSFARRRSEERRVGKE